MPMPRKTSGKYFSLMSKADNYNSYFLQYKNKNILLNSILSISSETFNQKFSQTEIKRSLNSC